MARWPQATAMRAGEQRRVDDAAADRDRSSARGRRFAPFDAQLAAVQHRPSPCGRRGRGDAAATRAAQAPVPQASVMPAPRSHTRMRMRSRDMICAKLDIGALGKQRMALELRAEAGEVDRFRVGHEEHARADCPSDRRPDRSRGPSAAAADAAVSHVFATAGSRASRGAPGPCRRVTARRRPPRSSSRPAAWSR